MTVRRTPVLDSETDLLSSPVLGLEVTTLGRGETVKLSLMGELDIGGRPTVERAVDEVFSRQPRQVVLDFSRLRFMDSAGVHITLAANDHAVKGGTDLVLVPGPPAVQRVFALASAAYPDCAFAWAEPSN
jgi:anti-anti-sigma factor